MSYLNHRCFQIFLLCCACSHALPKHILPAPALVRVLFQKHTSLACSCLSQPCSDYSLAHLCPALCQTQIHFPPESGSNCASSCVHHRLLLALFYVRVSPSLQDMLQLFTMEETGQRSFRGKPFLQQPQREAEDRRLPISPMASSPPALRCSLS